MVDTGGVEELYRGAYLRLVGILSVAAASNAEGEEVVQEAFLRLMPRWDTVSRYDDPEAWVRMVAFRLLSDRRRKARNGVRALLRLGPPPDVPAPGETSLEVRRALAQLPLQQRQVLVLHHLVGLPLADVASTLAVPLGTVKSRLHRGTTALAVLLRTDLAP